MHEPVGENSTEWPLSHASATPMMGREKPATWQSMPSPRTSELSNRLYCTLFSPRCFTRLSSAAPRTS
eukprot:4296554-Pyramimonas_sp.AAC.1